MPLPVARREAPQAAGEAKSIASQFRKGTLGAPDVAALDRDPRIPRIQHGPTEQLIG